MVNTKSNHNFYSPTRKKVLITLLILALLITTLFILEKKGVTNFYTKKPQPDNTKTTSEARSAQSDFNIDEMGDNADDGGRQAGNTIREDEGSAGIKDTSGSIDDSIDTSDPIISSTGEITLYTPKQNSTVGQQVTVAGTSSLDTVMYRVSDDVSGLISSGSLRVVDGKFSGTLRIETNGKNGQLDFYGIKSDGNEYSNIAVTLKFK